MPGKKKCAMAFLGLYVSLCLPLLCHLTPHVSPLRDFEFVPFSLSGTVSSQSLFAGLGHLVSFAHAFLPLAVL